MSRRGSVARIAAVFTVASVGAAVAQPAFAGSGSTDVPEPFSIHSGDTCRMGVAEGTIVWHLPPAGRTVDGKVTVADRPVPNDPAPGCRDDGRLTVLSVIGRVSGRPADQVLLEADNGQREYAFTLTATVRIEEVVVLVCRRTPVPGPPAYCGEAQIHHVPVTTTG